MLDALSHTTGDALLFYRGRERTIKFCAQRLQLLCQCTAIDIAALLGLHQLVRDVESRHDGDAIDALCTRIAAYFTHLAVEIGCGSDEARLFFRRAGNEEFAVENADRNR